MRMTKALSPARTVNAPGPTPPPPPAPAPPAYAGEGSGRQPAAGYAAAAAAAAARETSARKAWSQPAWRPTWRRNERGSLTQRLLGRANR